MRRILSIARATAVEILGEPLSLLLLLAAAVVAVLRHTENIKRLVNGTESRFVKK